MMHYNPIYADIDRIVEASLALGFARSTIYSHYSSKRIDSYVFILRYIPYDNENELSVGLGDGPSISRLFLRYPNGPLDDIVGMLQHDIQRLKAICDQKMGSS
jgi:hypothetical protein